MQDSASAQVDAAAVGDLEVLGEAFNQDPHELYRRLRVESPVYPVLLPRGTKVAMRITYDNSASNGRNPNRPPRWVRTGNRSEDEMGHV